MVRNIVAEKLARSTFETEELAELSPPAPGNRHSTIESNPPGNGSISTAGPSMSFRSAVSAADQDQFHLVGFEPAYGYRRHTPQGQNDDDADEEDDDDNEFLEWARIIGERSDGAGGGSGENQHRRLGEASGRDEFVGDSGQARDTPTNRDRDLQNNREFSGMILCFNY